MLEVSRGRNRAIRNCPSGILVTRSNNRRFQESPTDENPIKNHQKGKDGKGGLKGKSHDRRPILACAK